jgi:hypothetical protein
MMDFALMYDQVYAQPLVKICDAEEGTVAPKSVCLGIFILKIGMHMAPVSKFDVGAGSAQEFSKILESHLSPFLAGLTSLTTWSSACCTGDSLKMATSCHDFCAGVVADFVEQGLKKCSTEFKNVVDACVEKSTAEDMVCVGDILEGEGEESYKEEKDAIMQALLSSGAKALFDAFVTYDKFMVTADGIKHSIRTAVASNGIYGELLQPLVQDFEGKLAASAASTQTSMAAAGLALGNRELAKGGLVKGGLAVYDQFMY